MLLEKAMEAEANERKEAQAAAVREAARAPTSPARGGGERASELLRAKRAVLEAQVAALERQLAGVRAGGTEGVELG